MFLIYNVRGGTKFQKLESKPHCRTFSREKKFHFFSSQIGNLPPHSKYILKISTSSRLSS